MIARKETLVQFPKTALWMAKFSKAALSVPVSGKGDGF